MNSDIVKRKRTSVELSMENAEYLKQLAGELSEEFGHTFSLVAANAYAIKKIREAREQ